MYECECVCVFAVDEKFSSEERLGYANDDNGTTAESKAGREKCGTRDL